MLVSDTAYAPFRSQYSQHFLMHPYINKCLNWPMERFSSWRDMHSSNGVGSSVTFKDCMLPLHTLFFKLFACDSDYSSLVHRQQLLTWSTQATWLFQTLSSWHRMWSNVVFKISKVVCWDQRCDDSNFMCLCISLDELMLSVHVICIKILGVLMEIACPGVQDLEARWYFVI